MGLETTKEIQTDQIPISQNITSNKGISGEPSAVPRVGDEYQAKIPDPATTYQTRVKRSPNIPIIWAPHVSEEKQHIPLPGMHNPSVWSDFEKETFLLGLYIFGKRLNLVRQFFEGDGKTMGDVLLYYYGNFYKSDRYEKYKLKHCVLGPRIFQGWRQDMILLRLTESMQKESHDALQEVFKSYNEERTSFEDFIFALKGVAGARTLVQAISIGKGKHDLTKIRSDPTRNQTQTHLEMPVGKEWSSLSLEEVVRFLTGGFRLGKSRSNDLFWEAVWPCLLVKGWISVQPKDNTSIFLIPGIDSFPREDLVKGIHYFDSVTDLLSKVASDSNLISVPNNDANDDINDNENSRSCFRPKLQNGYMNLVKFTVIDTSIVEGEGTPCKFRALRSLPLNKSEVDTSVPEKWGPEEDETVEINAIKDAKLKSKNRVYVNDATNHLSKRRRVGLSKFKTKTCENDQSNPPCTDDQSDYLPDLTSTSDGNNEKEGTDSNNSRRRHGTRNRPPSTKALESVSLGFLGTTNRPTFGPRKSVETVICGSHENVPIAACSKDLIDQF
ncbi:uncharacterized protein LOC144554161 isoform X1 [Carex rostrata]